MEVISVYSESGGATKTTHAVSIATTAARQGRRVVLVDLDPRAAATKWTQVEPDPGMHVGAILAGDDVDGYVDGLAMPVPWTATLRIVPSARNVSNREAEVNDRVEFKLKQALPTSSDCDLVVIDCPNRQGGPLIKAALTASTGIVYAARPNGDGVDGVVGARLTVKRFAKDRESIGAHPGPSELGIAIGAAQDHVVPRVERVSIDDLTETGLVLTPFIPRRTIVEQVRLTGEWFGDYDAGKPVAAAYEELTRKVLR